MPTLHLARYILTDEATGRRRASRHVMTLDEALARDPTSELVPGSEEARQVPDDPLQLSTSGWQQPKG